MELHKGDSIIDSNGRKGTVIADSDPHNIRVRMVDGSEHFHCVVPECSLYDPLEPAGQPEGE